MTLANPFRYGVVVTGPDFVGRDREVREFVKSALSGQHLVLESPRRLGKSSLIREAFRRLATRVFTAYVDVYGLTSPKALGDEMLKALWGAGTALSRAERESLAARHLPSLRPRILTTLGAGPSLDVAWPPDPGAALEEVFEYPQALADAANKRLLVALDEFQDLRTWGGVPLVKRMRAHFQHHREVTYIFAGSRRHLLRQIFEEEEGAFFRFAKRLPLGPIAPEAFAPHIREGFARRPGGMPDDALEDLLRLTEGHPYATQRLCAAVWDLERRVRGPAEVREALRGVVSRDGPLFERQWDEVRSNEQRRLLRAVAAAGRVRYTTGFIRDHELKSAAQVQRSATQLESRGYLEEGAIPDLFFREWILGRIR